MGRLGQSDGSSVRRRGERHQWRLISDRWHRQVARSKWCTALYLAVVSSICRNFAGSEFGARMANLLGDRGINWPKIAFRSRSVVVGARTEVMLTPHIGEFDWAVLFGRRLNYEQPVFSWLEQNVNERYDAVIEIGANVGMYSVFFDALIKASPNSRLKRVTALTNSSLDKKFSGIFSDTVTETLILAISPRELERFFSPGGKVLVKIDVEGYEPVLMAAFQEIVRRYRPDFLIEVLEGTSEELEELDFMGGYERYLIGPDGLQKHPKLRADEHHRDWLLRAPGRPLSVQ
jgi:hypothetical protein